jgi:hypothetical protein
MSDQQQWVIRRTSSQSFDAQRRWDLAYQCLLKWSQAMREKEISDESRPLRPSINPASGRGRDD